MLPSLQLLTRQSQHRTVLIILALLGFATYFSGLTIPYYGYYAQNPQQHFSDLFSQNPPNGFFRPIESAFLNVVQTHFRTNALPIHLVALSMHMLLALLIFVFVIDAGFSKLTATLACALMMVSQANVWAVLGNDTLSQVAGTLFGWVSLWLLYRASFERHDNTHVPKPVLHSRYYCLSVLTFALSLFSKESSTSFFFMLLGILLLRHLAARRSGLRLSRTILQWLPYFIALGLYCGIRCLTPARQPALGSDRYDFHLGLNVVSNLAMLAVGATILISSVTGVLGVMSRDPGMVTLVASSCLLLTGVVGYGLWRSNERFTILAIMSMAVISFFPMAMNNHVNELYVYNSMPFVSILIGIGLGTAVERCSVQPRKADLYVILILLVMASHVVACNKKISLLRHRGERAAKMINTITDYCRTVHSAGTVYVVDAEVEGTQYEPFIINRVDVLGPGVEQLVKYRLGRDDVRVRRLKLSVAESADFTPSDDSLLLLFDGDSLRLYDPRVIR